MLTPEYLEQVGSDLSDLYYDLETEIIADIAERLKINGDRMTTTAEYLVMKLEQMGYQHEYIQRRLASIMNISEQKVSQILEDSTYQSMRDSLQRAKTYESVDGSSISFDEQILQSKTAINAELKNLTNSTARMATNTMLRTFDDAYMKVSSGSYSLNQAVDQAIKELIDTGIGQVTYRSGAKRNIDTAVRVAVRTGVNQNALKCEEQVLEATEHNLVVVSAHMGARPSHAEWQGKIYWRDHPEGDYENFEEATGYGTGAGLGGWNCRHQFFAYYPEMGNPYEDVDTKNNREVYELTQQQRYNERMIRKWKRRKAVYEKTGLDTTLENQKIREWTERNNALIKSSKYLKRQYANEKAYLARPNTFNTVHPLRFKLDNQLFGNYKSDKELLLEDISGDPNKKIKFQKCRKIFRSKFANGIETPVSKVYDNEDRFYHIAYRHPEMQTKKNIKRIESTLRSPKAVYKTVDKNNVEAFCYLEDSRDEQLIVVERNGKIITAYEPDEIYLKRNIKEKGELIWDLNLDPWH